MKSELAEFHIYSTKNQNLITTNGKSTNDTPSCACLLIGPTSCGLLPSPTATPPSPVTPMGEEVRVSAGGASRAHLREGPGLLLVFFFCCCFFWEGTHDSRARPRTHMSTRAQGLTRRVSGALAPLLSLAGGRHARALVPY